MSKVTSINQNWYFSLGNDNSSWEEVHLPHCVELSPLISSGGRNYQGICRYRKKFSVVKEYDSERVIIEFEGAMQVLELWINNVKLPPHYCGYIPAVYDITEHIHYNNTNIIDIRLDNSDNDEVPPGKPQSRLDFTYEGGLYRGVNLIQSSNLSISHSLIEDEVAGGGLWVYTEDVSQDSAKLFVQTHVKNTSDYSMDYTVNHIIYDENKNLIATLADTYSLAGNSTQHGTQSTLINAPQLWHSYSPHLYSVVTEITVDNKIMDSNETTFGIRDFKFTYDKGFLINGEHLKVSGANYHQTYCYVGNAMPDSMLKRDVRKYREAGMLHIRSHYPFAKSFIEECDRLGIMLIISNPGWQHYKDGVFRDRAIKNQQRIIRWLRNHPSIILWEPILNESVMPVDFIQALHNTVHEELPYGPCYTASDEGLCDVIYKEFDPSMLDANAFGHYTEEEFKDICDTFSKKPRWAREYGDCPDNFTDQSCAWRVPRAWGEDIMLKQVRRMLWDKYEYMGNYKDNYNNDTLCGFGMWPGMEHNRGYHINPCWGGFLDLYRLPKYSFYFFKSQRDVSDTVPNISSGPMVFIANSWSEISPDDITVYSNCDSVRLYHNDTLIEERTPDHIAVKHPPTTFKNDFYFGRQRSSIRAEGIINGEVLATDTRFSPGVPKELHLVPDDMGLHLEANGSDLLFIRCNVLDDHQNIVPLYLDAHDIRFSIKGPAKIIGDEIKRPEMGQTGVVIQSTCQRGDVTITAELLHPQKYSDIAVKPCTITIESH